MIVKYNKYQKEWHNATKPLKKKRVRGEGEQFAVVADL
jgi:hypothetical protein